MAPGYIPRYTCRCGAECQIEVIRAWIYVTCTNTKCKEYGVKQLATYGKHKAIPQGAKV